MRNLIIILVLILCAVIIFLLDPFENRTPVTTEAPTALPAPTVTQ